MRCSFLVAAVPLVAALPSGKPSSQAAPASGLKRTDPPPGIFSATIPRSLYAEGAIPDEENSISVEADMSIVQDRQDSYRMPLPESDFTVHVDDLAAHPATFSGTDASEEGDFISVETGVEVSQDGSLSYTPSPDSESALDDGDTSAQLITPPAAPGPDYGFVSVEADGSISQEGQIASPDDKYFYTTESENTVDDEDDAAQFEPPPEEPAKPAVAKSVETTEPVETTKSVESTKSVEPTKPAETTEPADKTEPAVKTEAAETSEPAETAKPVEPSAPKPQQPPPKSSAQPRPKDGADKLHEYSLELHNTARRAHNISVMLDVAPPARRGSAAAHAARCRYHHSEQLELLGTVAAAENIAYQQNPAIGDARAAHRASFAQWYTDEEVRFDYARELRAQDPTRNVGHFVNIVDSAYDEMTVATHFCPTLEVVGPDGKTIVRVVRGAWFSVAQFRGTKPGRLPIRRRPFPFLSPRPIPPSFSSQAWTLDADAAAPANSQNPLKLTQDVTPQLEAVQY